MNRQALLKLDDGPPTRAALIGVGQFGRALLAQSLRIPALRLTALCDLDVEALRSTAIEAGIAEERIAVVASAAAAEAAVAAGRLALTDDPMVAVAAPADVVVEATGDPESAARNALASIEAGRSLAMVSKEADVVVGPLLAAKARAAGVVMTQVDGDQPSLALGLVSWARALGFSVLCAGKASEHDFVLESGEITLTGLDLPAVRIDPALWSGDEAGLVARVAARADALSTLPQRTPPDVCELCLIANASGLAPDRPDLHAPIARMVELPAFFGPVAEGGALSGGGRLDVFNCLRRADEASAAGGVFAVLEAADPSTGRLFAEKGVPASADGRRFLVYNPTHLLGAEAPMSILAAHRLGMATGQAIDRPICDMTMVATRPLRAGEVLTPEGRHHRVDGVEARLTPALAVGEDAPIPFFMAAGRPLRRDVASGAAITRADVKPPPDSLLWRLRDEQDRHLH